MQTQAEITISQPSPRVDRLPPLERLAAPHVEPADTRPAHAAADWPADGGESTVDVAVLDDQPTAPIAVRYALDEVARTWVAHVFDAETGDLLKSVPSTEYHHQVAALLAMRRHGVDALA